MLMTDTYTYKPTRQSEPAYMWAVVIGGRGEFYGACGPFPTREEAIEWARANISRTDGRWDLVPLYAKGDYR